MFAMTASTSAAGQAAGQADSQSETQITLVGCVQREADYRKAHDSGRGGPASTGLGLKNEYVLVNAAMAGTSTAMPMCTDSGSGEAYELTGERESELETYVGRAVEITGKMKNAKLDVSGKPTGGFDPLGQDLELREVSIASVREAAAPRAEAAAEPAPAPEAVIAQARPEPAPVGTAGAQRELPRTAGPLPLTGLIGLLSVAGALGVRSLRRRQ
jgi:hypothetical protein